MVEADDASVSGSDGLVHRTVAAIIALMRSEDLRLGDALPSENALAARLGVSRVIVREANRSLSALGILHTASGRAARVSVPDYTVFGIMFDHVVHTHHVSVQQVLTVRRSIETTAVSLAALHRTSAEAELILGHAAAMRLNFADPKTVMEHDLKLHGVIAQATHNPMFITMVLAFEQVSRTNWPIGWMRRGREEDRWRVIEVHEAIAKAVADQDVTAAEHAMSSHFDDTIRALAIAGVS